MNLKDLQAVSECSLFSGIKKGEIKALLESNRYYSKNYHRDAIVRFQGDEYNELIIITGGEVRAEIHNPDGKKITIETLKKSDAVAAGVLFASDNTLPVTVVSVSDVSILLLPKTTVINLCRKNENFLINYLEDEGNKIVFLAEKIRLLKFTSISQKIASHIVTLSKKQGTDSVKLFYNREQMADLFGVARPSLSRGFSEFYDQGILKYEGKIIHILDKEHLVKIISAE